MASGTIHKRKPSGGFQGQFKPKFAHLASLPAGVGLFGVRGAQNDHFLTGTQPVLAPCIFSGINGNFPAQRPQSFADGFKGVRRGVKETDWLGQEMVHPGIDLGGGPDGEVQEGERFLDGAG